MISNRIGTVGAGEVVQARHMPGFARSAAGTLVSPENGGVHRLWEKVTVAGRGTEGTFRYIVGEDSIVGARGDSPLETIPLPDDTVRPWTVEADWVEAISTGPPVLPSSADGVLYMDVRGNGPRCAGWPHHDVACRMNCERGMGSHEHGPVREEHAR